MSYSIHSNTELGEVRLKVSDLERSVQFYREVVGFQILLQQSGIAQLTVDGINPLLILEEIPNAAIVPRRSSAGLYHFAILVPTREQLACPYAT
jgi:catechol 2,3-dioxygenase